MNSLPTIALFCLAASAFGAPQYGYRLLNVPSRPLNSYYRPYYNYRRPQPQTIVDTQFGTFPLTSQNRLSPSQRAQYLPLMKALLTVMESNRPTPSEVNTLMVLTRDLLSQVPEGQALPNFKNFGLDFDISSLTGLGLDLGSLKDAGLPKTGDIIIDVDGQNYIKTDFGSFPLSDLNLMSDEQKAQFLPAVRAFADLLEKDNLNPTEIKQLLGEAKKLDTQNFVPFTVRN